MLGRHHPLIRRIRALRRDAALRRAERLLIAEGRNLVREALAAGVEIEAVVADPRLGEDEEDRALQAAIARLGVELHRCSEETLVSLQDTRSPQPVLALVRRAERSDTEIDRELSSASLVAVFENIQDPGNLGSLLRTADAAGCDLCFVTGSSADPFHPRAVRATAGSIFRLVPVVSGSATSLDHLRRHGFRIVGADPHHGTDFDRATLSGRLALVLGGEGAGLSASARERLDELTRVPMRAGVESLSVGAAAAVLLFEAARQRRP